MTESQRDAREQSQPSTRERIQQTAIALFSEHGYEHTSLREIAEHLGVTKAALYYHFKTKEDIAASFFESYAVDLDRISDWGETQPRDLATRTELLRRYAEVIRAHVPVLKFMQYNQAALTRLDRMSVFRMRQRRLHALLVEADAPLIHRLRAWDALTTLYSNWITFPRGEDSEQEIRDASLQISIGMVEANDADRPAG
ncbi:TetR/AcrR family transcriptional regulator [Glycomyces harbinensis]|uniref:Transcriptional regulator, TetR family n=1 Tax=Glycomyces harbinensis TaxID=58114 RepID=A0A1G6SXK2_9ACTN|nr:TetR/AcrR family transcriptional regulator [Glycomyces harbinensis]SDD21592.1 transcriptional regulator, TetR family [Glycomyces harbinensis]